jgi:hypothetical protein
LEPGDSSHGPFPFHQNKNEDLEAVKQDWEQILGQRQGFFLEDKGWSLALHARFAEEYEAGPVPEQARRVAGKSRILDGHKFLEIAPSLAGKGIPYPICWLGIRLPMPACCALVMMIRMKKPSMSSIPKAGWL